MTLLVMIGDQPALCARISDILAPFGWECRLEEFEAAVPLLTGTLAAAVVLAGEAPDVERAVTALRKLPPPGNGTPIVMIGHQDQPLQGAGSHLPASFSTQEFIGTIEQWAGPVGDHALRADPPIPRYRMIRLIGRDNADAMLRRFADALKEALATARTNPEAVPAHRLAGIAGMLGYSDLHGLWSRVDGGETSALAQALAASEETLAAIG